MSEDLDLLLEKACSTTEGQLKATFLLAELQKLAPALHDEQTRAAGEEMIEKWSDVGGDPLRKGMAMAWLSRARAALAPQVAETLSGARSGVAAVKQAAGAVKGAVKHGAQAVTDATYGRAQNAAGDVGAAAGRKLANSRLNASRMAGIRAKGGEEARASMAERLAPKSHVEPFLEHEAAGPRLSPSAAPVDSHAAALAEAFRSGAASAAAAHASNAAKVGRVAARHAFKAGAMLGATGVAAAGAGLTAGHLSQKQHDQRVAAGKHSHQVQSGFAKAADTGELEKVVGANAGAVATAPTLEPHVQRLAELNAPKPKRPAAAGASRTSGAI